MDLVSFMRPRSSQSRWNELIARVRAAGLYIAQGMFFIDVDEFLRVQRSG